MIDCGSEYFCRHRSVTSSCQTSLHPPLSWQLCSCLQLSLIFNWMIGRGLLLVQSSVTECRAESMVPPRVGGWVGMEAKEEAGRPGQSRPWQNRTGQGSLLNSIWQYSAIFKSGGCHDNALRLFFALCGCACVCVYPRDFTIRAVMCGNFEGVFLRDARA